jgi:hypothetical protein
MCCKVINPITKYTKSMCNINTKFGLIAKLEQLL